MNWFLAIGSWIAWTVGGVNGGEVARKIVVAQDGSGSFTAIAAAVDSVKDASKDDPVDIVIKPGSYVETITTRNWINLVGENRDSCIIRFDGGPDTAVTHKKHTIWATSNTTLKNLTIVGIRVKYCIHSDGGGQYVLNLENCVLRREYPEGDPKNYSVAFGIGLHRDQHIMMKDCRLDADGPVFMHNWNDQLAPCSMTLERCVLKGKDYALWINCLGSKQRDFFVIHDSHLEGTKEIIHYENAKNVKRASPWNGQSEIELVGSGNVFSKVAGVEFKDDSQKRQSGIELAAQVKAARKPDNKFISRKIVCPTSPDGLTQFDGKIEGKDWEKAVRIDKFCNIRDGATPKMPTVVYLMRDGENLYIGWKANLEKGQPVRAESKTKDDMVWSDECFEIFFYGDQAKYHFIITSTGILWEAEAEGKSDLGGSNFTSGSKVKTYVADDYWSGEMIIPFKSLKLSKPISMLPVSWKANFCRTYLYKQGTDWFDYFTATSQTLDGYNNEERTLVINFK